MPWDTDQPPAASGWSAALLATGVVRPSFGRAGDDGAAIVRQYASLPDDPWAVCHGLAPWVATSR
jgi:hypothetical protein